MSKVNYHNFKSKYRWEVGQIGIGKRKNNFDKTRQLKTLTELLFIADMA